MRFGPLLRQFSEQIRSHSQCFLWAVNQPLRARNRLLQVLGELTYGTLLTGMVHRNTSTLSSYSSVSPSKERFEGYPSGWTDWDLPSRSGFSQESKLSTRTSAQLHSRSSGTVCGIFDTSEFRRITHPPFSKRPLGFVLIGHPSCCGLQDSGSVGHL